MISHRKLLMGLMVLSSVEALTLPDASGMEARASHSENTSFLKRHKGACLTAGLFVGTLVLYYTGTNLHKWHKGRNQTPEPQQTLQINITENIQDFHDHVVDDQDPQTHIFGDPQHLAVFETRGEQVTLNGADQRTPPQKNTNGNDNNIVPTNNPEDFGILPENQDGQTTDENLHKTVRHLDSLNTFGDENFSDDEENQDVDINPPANPIDQAEPQQNDLVQVETRDGKTVMTIAPDSNKLPDNFEIPDQLEANGTGVDTLVINLKSINNQFYDIKCKKLVLGEAVQTIEREAFMNSPFQEVDMTACQNLKTISISAFANTAITSISIPESVTAIRSQAFRNCTNLQTVIIPASFDPLSENKKRSADVFAGIPGITIQAPAGQKLHANWAKAGKFIGNGSAIFGSEIDGGTK